MRFKTFTAICYRFPIKSANTSVLLPKSTVERRSEIEKMGKHEEFTEDLKECSDDKKWKVVRE